MEKILNKISNIFFIKKCVEKSIFEGNNKANENYLIHTVVLNTIGIRRKKFDHLKVLSGGL